MVVHGVSTEQRLERALLAVSDIEPRPHLTDVAAVIGRLGLGGTLEYAATLGLGETATEAALRQAGATARKAGTGTVWMP